MSEYKLHLGGCLAVLPTLPAQSVEAIITDLPYGTTACSWDEIIPFAPMWAEVKRILKPRGVFVTTASQPFTSKLVMSNLEWFKYEWIWEKPKATGHLDCDDKPLKAHENIIVFCEGTPTYNPQMIKGSKHTRGSRTAGPAHVYGNFDNRTITESAEYFPRTVFQFAIENKGFHPTQKPASLYSYLIQTYTNPGDTVLDFTMGSGTTGCACMMTGRNFIGVELREDYFKIAERRIHDAAQQPLLFEEAAK